MKAGVHAVAALAALFLLDGCAEPSSTQTLQHRVAIRMNPAQTCNQSANIEYLPNGARVRISDASLFVVGRTDLSACGQYAVSSVVEAMLDPRIMQVVVEPASDINAPVAYLPRERAENIRSLLSNAGFVANQPPVLVQPALGPSGSWGIVLAVADQQ